MTTPEEVRSPAEIYDAHFVPALFARWGPIVTAAAGVKAGDRVLDVACGTGAATLAAADKAGPSGRVIGLDANPEMLAVARRKPTQIEWVQGTAEALPMSDDSFDAVVSQFGLMFFEDKPKALREMMRVLCRGDGMAVAVCDAVENSPGYCAFAKLLDRLFGREVGDAFRAPFALGDARRLHALCREAGIVSKVTQHHEIVSFNSIDALVSTERACVWTLGGVLDDDQFARLLVASRKELKPFVSGDGGIQFDMPSLIVSARKV
ncbi:class I SAM-dependent methyltransferase [Sinorhizobium chiapasense]|uniref:Class I SAM-dependent methyltransferase n=1 Tax=Sinorhizobium chiapasense TaxID=501572 RepID=A0ABZ2BM74_9HYPH